MTLDADTVGFQEVFDEAAFSGVIPLADAYSTQQSDFALPDATEHHRKGAIFHQMTYGIYRDAEIAFAPAMNDGEAGNRRPGVAIVSRLGLVDEPEILSGAPPLRNSQWMLRHDTVHRGDRSPQTGTAQITRTIRAVPLHAAKKLFVRKSLCDRVYTSAFGGVYESINQIYLSRQILPENPDKIGEMEYSSVLNDHLTDGSHRPAPYTKLASDHGQIMARIKPKGDA